MSCPSNDGVLEQLRADLDGLAEQLERLTTWELALTVSTASEDPAILRIEEHCNQVLETARKRIAEADEILRWAADGIVTIDETGVILTFNSMAENIFGHAAVDVIGTKVNRLMPSSYGVEHDDYLSRYLRTGEARIIGMRREVRGVRKDGSEFPLDLHVSEISREPTRFSAVVRDLTEAQRQETEQRRLEALLSHARKLETVGELAAGIAHEINTPIQYVGDNTRFLQESFVDILDVLQAVNTMAEQLANSAQGADYGEKIKAVLEAADFEFLGEEIPRAIQQSQEGIERVASIVGAMKEFSHPGGTELEAHDINRAITNTIQVARSEWKYIAHMDLDLCSTLPPVPCFLGELNQVLLNLVVNSAHSIADANRETGREMGSIRISTRLLDEHVEIRVEDTGTGIPEEFHERIFDPFFTSKEVGQGTGQGLSIAHSVIVKKHGGALTFETIAGRGTVFFIRLPLSIAVQDGSTA